jgi:Fibronectin type III domain
MRFGVCPPRRSSLYSAAILCVVLAALVAGATVLATSAQAAIEATEGARFSGRLVTSSRCGIFRSHVPRIEWGDRQTSEGTVEEESFISGSHTYAEEGTFNGSVTFEGDCGEERVLFQAKVLDAALSATGAPVSANAGTQFSGRVAKFTDADPGGVVSDYTASIEWGDDSATAGTISAAAGGGFEVKGSHTYTVGGVYKTSITIKDVGGAKATATSSANVAGPPLVSNVSVVSVTETTAKIGFEIDPDGADTTYVIEYGPTTSYGQKTAPVDIGEARGAQSLTQTLTGLTPGSTYHFNVVATNAAAPSGVGGGDQSFTTSADAPLTATGVPVSGTAGVALDSTVAKFTDADPSGVASDYTATITWGDGTASTMGTVSAAVGGGFEVKGSHTYATGGVYKTSVTIDDVGGATATVTSSANLAGPPVVSNVSVVSVTETTSTVAFKIDPDGADTTYVIEYGPTTSYGQKTAPVGIGETHGAQSLTRTLTGLTPGSIYHFNVVATNSVAPKGMGAGDQPFTTAGQPAGGSGSSSGGGGASSNPGTTEGPLARSGVLSYQGATNAALTLADLPPPVLGKTVNVAPVSGVVLVELPPGATLASVTPYLVFAPFSLEAQAVTALTKGQGFVPLTEARQIPVGSVLDTTRGVVAITTATTASAKGKLQSGDFGAGLFKLLQGRKQRGLTDLDIINTHSARQVCATQGKARIAARQLSSKVLGRLNASGHGNFSARGTDSAATVRGTIWSVANQCDGTLTKVTRGVVSVRDFRRRKTITLFTGQSYLARGPLRRG